MDMMHQIRTPNVYVHNNNYVIPCKVKAHLCNIGTALKQFSTLLQTYMRNVPTYTYVLVLNEIKSVSVFFSSNLNYHFTWIRL